MIPEPTTTLEQKAFLRGSQRFEVIGDGSLEYTFRTFRLQRRYRVPLAGLDPNGVRYKYVPVGALVCAIGFGLAALGTLACVPLPRLPSDRVAVAVIASIFAIVALGCACQFIASRVNCLTICSRYNGGAVISLWFELPDRATYEAFCQTLKKSILAANQSRPNGESPPASLAQEILELKKLMDAGVLTAEEFERAKAKLIGTEEMRRIGFHAR